MNSQGPGVKRMLQRVPPVPAPPHRQGKSEGNLPKSLGKRPLGKLREVRKSSMGGGTPGHISKSVYKGIRVELSEAEGKKRGGYSTDKK